MKFLLFSDLIPTKGFNRSIILDPNRNDYHFIFNEFYNEIIKENPKEDIREYCLDNELGFLCPENLISNFKKKELSWETPSLITNCIIELNSLSDLKFISIIENLGCVDFTIIIKNIQLIEFIKLMSTHFEIFDRSKCIEFIFRYNTSIIEHLINNGKDLFSFSKIKSITFFESPENEVIFQPQAGLNFVHCIDQNFDLIYSCENHSWEYFSSNIDFISEALNFHTYFNRKLYIGKEGEIKRSPLDENDFGNIREISSDEELKEIINKPNFQLFWKVKKDNCDVCKDCELRLMCLDSRIPILRKKNEYFFKSECNYNPYISKWKGEKGYLNLSKCGIVSDENSFSLDYEKIKKINLDLWGED